MCLSKLLVSKQCYERREPLDLPDEKEEVGLFFDSIYKPLLLNHISDLLNSGVLVISGKIKEDTKSSDFATPDGGRLIYGWEIILKLHGVLSCLELGKPIY